MKKITTKDWEEQAFAKTGGRGKNLRFLFSQDDSLVNMHIHSNVSDGHKTPQEIGNEAQKLGLKFIAITDHDTIKAPLGVANSAG